MPTADPHQKAIRKYVAVAFYKNNLHFMLNNLKEIITNFSKTWMEQIENSEEKSIVIDIAKVFK